MGREAQLLEAAFGHLTQVLCFAAQEGSKAPATGDFPNLLSPSDCFSWSVDRLGEIARDAGRHLEESGAATALIEAAGDRIDRLNAENRETLDALVKGRSGAVS